MRDGDGAGLDPWEDDLGETVWVSGSDAVAGWVEADSAAREFRDLLLRLGVPAGEIHAAAGTGTEGLGTVRLKASPHVVRWLGCVLTSVDMEAVPKAPFCEHERGGESSLWMDR
jgi:hypothetical protein